jgi:hypothetical protein
VWEHQITSIENPNGVIVSISSQGSVLSYADVFGLLIDAEEFRNYLLRIFADIPYSAFRWETPPVTVSSLDKPFKFAVLDSPELDLIPDRMAFAEFFETMDPGGVGEFPNLGGDANMIVPGPVDETSAYSHLASFLSSAPYAQLHLFWQMIGTAVSKRIGAEPLWLNTAGGGVAWLHVRLDQRPKYYVYPPYRDAAYHNAGVL